jgi:hypothetical protein
MARLLGEAEFVSSVEGGYSKPRTRANDSVGTTAGFTM